MRRRTIGPALGLTLALLLPGESAAQSSARYRLDESVVNGGGEPRRGVVVSSAGFRLTLGAIGAALSGNDATGPSFLLAGGFVPAYPPPTEVLHLLFHPDRITLSWDDHPAAGTYALYRDLLSNRAAPGAGNCLQSGIAPASTADKALPPVGEGFFYLATAVNRLHEEGTLGSRSDGVERLNDSPCP